MIVTIMQIIAQLFIIYYCLRDEIRIPRIKIVYRNNLKRKERSIDLTNAKWKVKNYQMKDDQVTG